MFWVQKKFPLPSQPFALVPPDTTALQTPMPPGALSRLTEVASVNCIATEVRKPGPWLKSDVSAVKVTSNSPGPTITDEAVYVTLLVTSTVESAFATPPNPIHAIASSAVNIKTLFMMTPPRFNTRGIAAGTGYIQCNLAANPLSPR